MLEASLVTKKIISPHPAAMEVVQVGTAGKPRILTKESLQKLQVHMSMHQFSIKEKKYYKQK